MTRSVGIFLFDQVEALDLAGPYEVFTTAARMAARQATPGDAPLFDVFTVGATRSAVRGRAGLVINADYSVGTHPPIDLLIVPGGVVTAELARPEIAAWIAGCAPRSEITASICTGAFLLAHAGLLRGRRATTHWEDVDELRTMFPDLEVVTGVRWVDEGSIVTSAGISAGIDMSLHLVERVAGRALADRTARQMDFTWTGNG